MDSKATKSAEPLPRCFTATAMLTFNGVLVATFTTWAEGYERERENLIEYLIN
jgi:hypothetical protein